MHLTIIPTYAYRDEGTSYHYATPSDYIKIKNASVVSNFMKEQHLPFVEGKTWTTMLSIEKLFIILKKENNPPLYFTCFRNSLSSAIL